MNGSQRIRPWHWLTILSLDAPVVALVWQDFLARTFSVAITPVHRFVLALSVWLAYVADRWFDGRALAPGTAVTMRHRFAGRHSRPILTGWMFVLTGTILLAVAGLSRREFVAGLTLTAAVLAYLAACHRQSWRKRFGWLKEFAVALLISSGAALFVFTKNATPTLPQWLALGILAGLCFLNCAVVSFWEQGVDARQGQSSLALRFTLRREALIRIIRWSLALTIAAAILIPWTSISRVARAAALTLIGVLLLLRQEARIDLETRHLLIDVTLLSPLLLIPFL